MMLPASNYSLTPSDTCQEPSMPLDDLLPLLALVALWIPAAYFISIFMSKTQR